MKYFGKNSDLVKPFYRTFLPLFILVTSLMAGFFSNELKSREEILKTVEQRQLEILIRVANDNIKVAMSDLFCLSINPVLHQMIAADSPITRQNLTQVFLNFSKKSKLYDQIRFLDETGMEKVRINFNNGKPIAIANDKLQNKAKRYYFADAFSLESGKVFMSPFDLNIEHGQLENPLKPVIRFATPVFDSTGKKRGIILLNYFGSKMIADLSQSFPDSIGSLMLLNSRGYWLKGLNPDDEWGFMYENRQDRTLANRDTAAWNKISILEEGQLSTENGLYTFATVCPLWHGMVSSTGSGKAFESSGAIICDKAYNWKIVALISEDALNAHQAAILLQWLPTYGLLILFLAFISFGMALVAKQRKRTEQVKLHNEKLQAIVEMAGAVCHEMNQPLHAISGFSELLLMDLSEDNPAYPNTKKIKEEVDKIAKITKKLAKITKYATKDYLKGRIVDIDKAADSG